MEMYVKLSFPYFIFFSGFQTCVDFTHIEA